MLGIKTFFKYCIRRQFLMYVVAAGMIVGLYSCKHDIPKRELLSNYEVNNFSELFKVFWQGMNSNYLFWDKETMNWDNMYREYKPKFDSLDMRPYSDTTMNICFQYMADMTKDLKDGQYALQLWNGGDFRFEDSLYKSYITLFQNYSGQKRFVPALPDTLFDYIIQYNYLKDFDYGVYRNFNTLQIFQIITGRISKGSKNIIVYQSQ